MNIDDGLRKERGAGSSQHTSLTIEQTKEMLLAVARGMIASELELSEADRATGDGDHGTGIKKSGENIIEKLGAKEFDSVAKLFVSAGAGIMATGGSSGAVFGTWFRAAKGMAGDFDSQFLAKWLDAAVSKLGKKDNVGEKTMFDALKPAADVAQENSSSTLLEALTVVHAAAIKGKDATRDMAAQKGRARYREDKGVGHLDPGAITVSLIFQFMKDHVESL